MYQLGLFTLIRVVIMKLPARVELQYLFRMSYLLQDCVKIPRRLFRTRNRIFTGFLNGERKLDCADGKNSHHVNIY